MVVRRGHVRDGMMPVGVRGLTRSQRFAAFLAVAEIADRLSPEDLTDSRYVIEQKRKDAVAGPGCAGARCAHPGEPRSPLGARRQCRLRDRDWRGDGDMRQAILI